MMLIFYLYIFLTKTSLDIFNCNSTTPPDGHKYGSRCAYSPPLAKRSYRRGCCYTRFRPPTAYPCFLRYLEVVFVQCNKPGGMQLRLLPFAISSFLVYTVGFPSILALVLIKYRNLIKEDQVGGLARPLTTAARAAS